MKKMVTSFVLSFVMLVLFFSSAGQTAFAYSTGYPNTHSNTGNQKEDIIAVAETQIGYTYSDGTKYGAWYGSSFTKSSWCAMFVSWCANQANISTSIIPKHADCDVGMNWFKNSGRWHNGAYYGGSYTPQRGDIVYYSDGYTQSDSTHVGIITGVSNGYLQVIEGNTDKKVHKYTANAKRMLSSGYVLGYGTPNYNGVIAHTRDTNYGTNFTATAKIHIDVFNEDHSDPGNYYIDPGDVCTIHEVYTDGCCKVTYPSDSASSGLRTLYCKFNNTNFTWETTPPPNEDVMNVGYDRVLPDGDYAIVSHVDRNYQLDIAGDDFPAGINANIQLFQVGSFYREQDIFTLSYNETDKFYTISQKGTSMFLDVSNNSKELKTNVQIHTGNGTSAQKWAISQVWNGDTWLGYRIQAKSSGYSLDIDNANLSNETNVQIYENNNSSAQLWSFIPYRPQQPVANGSYVLISALDPSIELDVWGDYPDAPNGSNVQVWHDNAPSQYNSFDIVKLDNGYYKFYHTGSGRLLDVDKASMELGANVQLWEETGSTAQQWAIIPYKDGYIIVAGCSGLVLDVAYAKAEDGANVWQHTFNGSNAQIWKFKKAENTISYDANGGTNAPSRQTKYYGATVTLRAELPTKNGYTFVKWNTKADGTGISYSAGGTYSANSDVTLYAQWNSNPTTYTVSYNANGGSGVPSNQTKYYGQTLTLSSQKPIKNGYNFVNWNTNPYGYGTSYDSGGQYTANAAVTLYAQWKPNTYTITYNANGGSGAPAAQTKKHDEALTISGTKPILSSYTFLGWAETAKATTAQYQPSESFTCNENVTLYAVWKAATVSSVVIKNKPTKTTYNVGDTFDASGMKLKATYDNGDTKEITSGYTYTPSKLNTMGQQKIVVSYGGKSTDFYVTVNALTVKQIRVTKKPTKTSYIVGDTLNTSGMQVTVTYSDDTTKVITSGFKYTPSKLDKVGTQWITVTYGGTATAFPVSVKAVSVDKIRVTQKPTKTTYVPGNSLNISGMQVTVTYTDGTTKVITEGFTCTPTKFTTVGLQWITVKYGGTATAFPVNVVKQAQTIRVIQKPTKTTYIVGNSLNTSGLKLRATYADGTTQDVTSGFTCTPTKLTAVGNQWITVVYGGQSTAFVVKVESRAKTVRVTRQPTKKTYLVGEALNTSGMQVTATYDDGTTKVVTDGFVCSPVIMTKAGTQWVTVIYGGQSTAFPVTVA